MSTRGERLRYIRRHFVLHASGSGLRLARTAVIVALPLMGWLGGGALVRADPTFLDVQRGQLLYEAQCVSCHTTQVHWRDTSIVGSWRDVLAQVQRWQDNTGQHWSPSEVEDVGAYLNAVYYKLPCSKPGCQGKPTAAYTHGISAAKSE